MSEFFLWFCACCFVGLPRCLYDAVRQGRAKPRLGYNIVALGKTLC